MKPYFLLFVVPAGLAAGYTIGKLPALNPAPAPVVVTVPVKTEPDPAEAVTDFKTPPPIAEDPKPEEIAALSADQIVQHLLALINGFSFGMDDYFEYQRQCRLLLRNLSPQMKKEVFLRLANISVPKMKSYLVAQLLMQLGEDDPGATFQAMQQRKGQGRWFLGGMLATWYQQNPEAALAALNQPENRKNRQLVSSFLTSLAATNPKEALRLAESELGAILPGYSFASIVGQWALKDPRSAATYALQLEKAQDRQYSIQQVLSVWSTTDLPGALAWSQALPAGKDRDSAVRSAISNWMQKNPDEAVAYVAAMPEGKEKQKLISSVSYALGNLEPDVALPLIEAMPEGDEKNQAMRGFTSRWAQSNPKDAAEYLADMPGSSNVTENLKTSLMGWSKKDPQAALDFAMTLDAAQQHQVLPQLLGRLAETRPDLALKVALAMFDESAVKSIAKTMAATNPQGAFASRNQIPEGAMRDGYISNIMQAWAATNPKAAAVQAMSLTGNTLKSSIDALMPALMAVDVDYAKQWAMSMPDTDFARPKAVYLVSQNLGKQDPAKASAYIDSFPTGQLRDQATRGMSWAIADNEPSQALNLMVNVSDVPKRNRDSAQQYAKWKSKDSAAAAQWLSQATLPDDLRKALTDIK